MIKINNIDNKKTKTSLGVTRYLQGRQGIALQGHDGNDNFTQLLRLLGTNNEKLLIILIKDLVTSIHITRSKMRFWINISTNIFHPKTQVFFHYCR